MGVRSRVREWRGRSRIAQVDSYMRWTLYGLPWIFPVVNAVAWPTSPQGMPPLAWLLLALGFAQSLHGVKLIRRALEHYLRKKPAPWWHLSFAAALFAATVVVFMLVARKAPGDPYANGMMLLNGGLVVFGSYSILTRRVRTFLAGCAGAGAAVGLALLPLGSPLIGSVVLAVALFLLGVWAMATVRSSAWFLAVLWEAEAARATQARLAVAEERLRFSRDMHDVLGRNLAVIALKSELAVQLSRRGSDAAVDQMTEVQRIAQESQRELREVVRGYREADLHTELVGAKGVLAAAGIHCRVDADAGAHLPSAVQSALAWVAREATTNVLRHAEASRCAVRLRVVDGVAVLRMENDGVRGAAVAPAGAGGGSGLAGLRERLTALGGTLTVERGAHRTFHVTARIPLAAAENAAGPGMAPPPARPAGPFPGGGAAEEARVSAVAVRSEGRTA
ncbi:sensor histidine kinase [Streptomyces sp. NPDC053048]|uniref:sensor histidine kinase n=1 Tax=Streptomyces sp. NPDC053048 TaxID=3365694 RepID=UPI0037D525AD